MLLEPELREMAPESRLLAVPLLIATTPEASPLALPIKRFPLEPLPELPEATVT